MKKIIYIFIVVFLVFVSTGCFEKKNTDALKFKEEYESLNGEKNQQGKIYPKVDISKDNPIKYSSIEKIVKIIEKGTGVIYFGFPKCPWCRSAVPALLNAAVESGIDTIYYLNVTDVRDSKVVDANGKIVTEKEGSKEYPKLLKALDKYLDEYVVEDANGKKYKTGEKRIYVPLVVFVRNGKVIGTHLDTVKSQKDPYKGLTEEQNEELSLIYYKYMNKMLGDSCDENC